MKSNFYHETNSYITEEFLIKNHCKYISKEKFHPIIPSYQLGYLCQNGIIHYKKEIQF